MLTARQREVMDLKDKHGLSFKQIADKLGRSKSTISQTYWTAERKLADKKARLDPGIHKTLDKFGMGDLAANHSGWVHKEDEKTGEWVSTYYFLGQDGAKSQVDLEEILDSAIEKVMVGKKLARPKRPKPNGDNLLIIDIADLHIGKLCVKSETGFHYDREVAITRGIEGTKRLLEKAKKHGVAHILFVIGNDILHIDTPNGTTTAGTRQDTDGTIHVMFEDAQAFYIEAIDLCRAVAPVSLLYVPSNHDWFSGYALARTLRSHYRKCEDVIATDYNMSKRHRKYFVFGNNIIGQTHGDGAKEKDLPELMLAEAGAMLADCPHRTWYLHHLHHKIAKRGAGRDRFEAEKDHIGNLSIINQNSGARKAGDIEFEVVRSASAPDGWHDRNAYVNRQAVECFMHCPHDGPDARFTTWF
jgi:hypothetical protein